MKTRPRISLVTVAVTVGLLASGGAASAAAARGEAVAETLAAALPPNRARCATAPTPPAGRAAASPAA